MLQHGLTDSQKITAFGSYYTIKDAGASLTWGTYRIQDGSKQEVLDTFVGGNQL
jgi:hypothetical protein